VAPGDRIVVLPSGKSAEVGRIVTFDGDLDRAQAPLSVTLVLDRELDISRGDLIAAEDVQPVAARRIKAALVWMDQRPLARNRRYLLKHTSKTVPAFIASLEHRTNVGTLAHEAADTLELNEIGVAAFDLLHPIALDLYSQNRSTGAFVLIDPETNGTVAAGMITAASAIQSSSTHIHLDPWGRVTAGEREARWGHRGAVLELNGPTEMIDSIERSLFSIGVVSSRIEADGEAFLLHPNLLPVLTRLQVQSGLLVLVATATGGARLDVRTGNREIALDAADPQHAVAAVHRLLYETGILISSEKAGL